MPQNALLQQAALVNLANAVDAATAYEEHLADAQAIETPQPYRWSIDLVLANIQVAKKFVIRRRARILEQFPLINIAHFDTLGRLALGVKFAALQAEGYGPSESDIKQVLGAARVLRRSLLSAVAAMTHAGLLPREIHAKIARGRGARDAAEDCVALAQVFRQAGTTLDGKHPVTAVEVEQAALAGSWLLEHLRPAAAKPMKPPRPEAVRIRDQMATLLANRYAKLQAMAHFLEGDGWEELVPPLMSRVAPRSRTEPAKKAEGSAQAEGFATAGVAAKAEGSARAGGTTSEATARAERPTSEAAMGPWRSTSLVLPSSEAPPSRPAVVPEQASSPA
ncbi:hypothetical protein [Chondromyces crocatus]|uniref:Uncharacterized protein n=1 Tax=Chondromyces crocatus TaxID=52 RepID=A0A0K1EH54_CHOCO|nr:hypothetical protein [Chondromyces crocatus]AKT40190.1 uncharacterized protein CMC5_043430 [Chondromyces crocatus]